MNTLIGAIRTTAMAAAFIFWGLGVAHAQSDTNLSTIAYWKMNQWSTNLPNGGGFTHGIADLATNAGQGTLTGAAAAPAAEEDLYVWGPMENNFQIVPAVPPLAMFNPGFNNGGGSWNSAHNLGNGGQMLYLPDQFGNEFTTNASGGLTIEIFFKSATQSGAKQTLIWNFEGSAYTHLQLNEDGDTGSLLFWGYNGGFPGVRIAAVDNGGARFDDGNWHYAAMRYDAGHTNMILTVINQDGSSVSRTKTLGAPLFPGNKPGNLFIGRTEGEGDRFNGLINQVRISKGALPDGRLLAVPGSAEAHVQGYWKFDKAGPVPENILTSLGILDLATNAGQGTLSNPSYPSIPASVDNLWVLGNLAGSMTFASAVPPGGMFNTNYPYTAGSGSWDSGSDLVTLGEVTFQHDVYGADMNKTNGGTTTEVFFKSSAPGTATGRQTLVFNQKGNAYNILQVSEDGDTGSLLFWGYNGNFVTVRITAADNGGHRYDDGNWHYAVMRYDTGTKVMSLMTVNEDGSTVEKTQVLTADLVAANSSKGGTVTFGRDENQGAVWNGLINQVRISDQALPNRELLARTSDCIPAVVYSSPQPAQAYLDEPASFSVVAGGTKAQIQWRLNGTNLVGKTNAILDLFPVRLADAGNYDALAYTACSGLSVTSAPALLTVIPTRKPVANLARWSMEAQANPLGANGNPIAQAGILDSDTALGQGVVSNGVVVAAAYDPLITFNSAPNPWAIGANGGIALTNDVPPASMFINGNTGGANSFDASFIAGVDGVVFFPQDAYGDEFDFRTSFSIELFFKTAGDRSAAGRMQLLSQGTDGGNTYRYGLVVNEAGPGTVRFAVNNNASFQVVDVTNANYADGRWHYLVAKYDSAGNQISLAIANADNTSHTAVTALPTGYSPLFSANTGNLFVGRNRYSIAEDHRTFLGLIDEVQITSGLVTPGTGQLGLVQGAPVINSVTVSGGTLTIKFTGNPADAASAYTLVGSSTVDGIYGNQSATLTSLGAGGFQATMPVSGSTGFYRIKR